jgi:hypothetical protein
MLDLGERTVVRRGENEVRIIESEQEGNDENLSEKRKLNKTLATK